jgi:hypothetical protein
MGCGCGKRAGSLNSRTSGSGGGYTYQLTTPDGEIKGPYLTALEAKAELRRVGGGTLERIVQPTPEVTPEETPG